MFALILFACSGSDGPGPPGTDPGELGELEITVSEVVPTTFELSWTTPESGTSWVEFGEVVAGERSTAKTVLPTSAHVVRMVGLKSAHTYVWRAVTELADGTRMQSGENEVVVAPPPAGMPKLNVTVTEQAATLPAGHLVTGIIEADGGWVVVLDGDGDIVWWFDTGHAGTIPADLVDVAPPSWNGHGMPISVRLDEATSSVLLQFFDGNQVLDVATLRRIPIDAMTIDDLVTTRTDMGHHDYVFHADEGAVGWVAYQTATDGGTGTVWVSDVILEAEEGNRGGENLRPIWSWHDDFDAEPFFFNDLQAEPLADLGDAEWTHSNSLMYDAGSDSYFLMSKFLDCLVKIDRQTGTHEWVMGGMYSDFQLEGGGPVWLDLHDSRLWSHAHMSHLWYDAGTRTGGLVVFDNGYYYPDYAGVGEGWSRVSELSFDEQAGTVDKVWEYIEPTGAFTGLLGDVRKLESGNYLVAWSTIGRIEEITPEGEVVWRALMPLGSLMTRLAWYDSFPP